MILKVLSYHILNDEGQVENLSPPITLRQIPDQTAAYEVTITLSYEVTITLTITACNHERLTFYVMNNTTHQRQNAAILQTNGKLFIKK